MAREKMNERIAKKANFLWTILLLTMFSGVLTAFASSAESQKNATEALLSAARNVNVETLTRLIREGAEVNAVDNKGNTPLIMAAAYSSNPEVMQALIENGADASIQNKEGQSALDYAVQNKSLNGRGLCFLIWHIWKTTIMVTAALLTLVFILWRVYLRLKPE